MDVIMGRKRSGIKLGLSVAGLVIYTMVVSMSYSQSELSPPPGYRSPVISLVKANKTTLGQYEKLELTVTSNVAFDNPFNPDEVKVEVRIKGPDGSSIIIPGFYYQEYQRTLQDNKEVLKKYMESCWKIRYAPVYPGRYTYTVSIQDKYRLARSDTQEFTVIRSKNSGYLRTSKVAPYYLQFDNGEPYLAIGHNVCWYGAQGTYDYDKYFEKMSNAGENFTRIWMIDWSLGLEFPEKIGSGYDGLGRYNLENAYKLDYILDLAEKKGIYIMLCFDSFSNLRMRGNLGHFKDFPYSDTQLGPCSKPEEFFTNEKAKQYYKKRIQYILSRYGYSTHILAWEFWNEVDLVDNYNSDNITNWHQEMAKFVRENDPYQHLITTSFSNARGDDKIWALPEMDIVQSHLYNILDVSDAIHTWCEQKTLQYKKPHIFGEFGLDAGGITEVTEPSGLYLHNGIWSAIMSRSAGTPMSWCWDNYTEPNNLYRVYSGLAKFTDGINWNRAKYDYLQASQPKYTVTSVTEQYTDLVIQPAGGWGDKSKVDIFHILTNGTVSEKDPISTFIYGTTKQDLVSSHKFAVDYPANGKFSIHVNQVSRNAVLKILVDGKEAYTHEFNPTSGKGEWKEERFNSEYAVYQNLYNNDYGMDIKKGKHTIELVNEGTDWISIGYLTLTNYLSSNVPNIRVYGLQTDNFAMFWVQNKENTWYNKVKNLTITPVKDAVFDITGLKPGRYKLEWYDTDDAIVVSSWTLTNHAGTVTITIPELRTDIAAKLTLIEQ